MSTQDAQKKFDEDVRDIEDRIRKSISVALYQHESDALMSLAFNMGGLTKAPRLCKKLNDCDYVNAPEEFMDIENKTGRKREYDMFCQCIYNSNH